MFRNRNHNAHEIDFNCICMHALIQLVGGFLRLKVKLLIHNHCIVIHSERSIRYVCLK